MASFSGFGYMIGTIDGSDVWTGDFYLPGFEARRDTFELTLSGSTFSGSFTEAPGTMITYDITSTQSDTAAPSDLLCLRTDDEYLGQTSGTSFTGQ